MITHQVKLPAEQEDWQKRPAYIKVNNAGVNICENRCVPEHYLPQIPKTLFNLMFFAFTRELLKTSVLSN